MSNQERTTDTWHVTLFRVHPDRTATSWAWWVDGDDAAAMLAAMGPADGEQVYSAADVEESIADGSKVPLLTPIEETTNG